MSVGANGRQLRNGDSARARRNAKVRPGELLSDRELQIVRRLCRMDEPTVEQVARDIGLATVTVNDHITRIYRKLGVRTRLGMYRVLTEYYDVRME